jgi:PBSX family phage portal protein
MSDQHVETHAHAEVFTFGDPVPVLDAREILDYVESWWNGEWYEPPVSVDGLAKSFRANPHHGSAIYVKRNILVSSYIPHKLLPRQEFSRWVLDFLTFGNAYLEKIDNRLQDPLQLKSSPAKFTRKGREGRYFFVQNWVDKHEFKPGSIFHLLEPDVNQEIYGLPEYLSALQSAWLNEAATLYRRKYYTNGSHAGFVMYMTDPVHEEADITNLRNALKEAKGPGNFRNLFMYAPNGKKDGIQIIPIAEVQAKDEFFNIKNVSRDDVLAAHRVPPQLLGIVPTNTAGFGDVEKAAAVFSRNELEPLQERLKELNDWLGQEVIRFRPYSVMADA